MIATLVGLLAATPPHAPASVAAQTPVLFAQLTVRSRVIIRVQSDVVPVVPVEVIEKKGPKCIALASLAGFAVAKPDSVDLIQRGGQRLRMRFSSNCPTLDYYSGFYIVPNADGMVCADRDVVRSRAGGECPIDRIRTLVIRPRK